MKVKKGESYVEKRAFQRISTNITIEFLCNNINCSGSITNLSEKGMFIKTEEMCFPSDSQFEIFFPLKEKIVNVTTILKRLIMSPDSYDGIGVELSKPPWEYLEFVSNLRSA